ncbi:hypothetical protein [Deinococcus sedimenti]|uniref:Uncharacterized protein n=1 Tax=Deinococcus sedimenti TaxID=1867090 RepID=A0ABQ2SBK6_9DEIO|nr:hypothetical protein [Deinococcus sedimenti]GGS08676.1 hypothetical protein GCM10008960_38790 [Deinococcus sedimenti]
MLARRHVPAAPPRPHPNPIPGSWQRPLPCGVTPLAHHLGRGGTVLWTDGALLPGVGDHTLPILSRAWLSTLAALRSPHDDSTAHRHLRLDLLTTALHHPDPTWSAPWIDCGLHIQDATCGPWTLYRVHAGGTTTRVFPFEVPTWAAEDLHTRPIRLWSDHVPTPTTEHEPPTTPVLLWPAARPLTDLLTALTHLHPEERTDLHRAARRVALTTATELAHDPQWIDTPDVLRV